MRRCLWPVLPAVLTSLLLPGVASATHFEQLEQGWPARDVVDTSYEEVTLSSSSPFMLSDVNKGPEADPETEITVDLYLPDEATADTPVPAVVLLHGAAGVIGSRERFYAQQFADMGIAAAVVDVFAPRRDMATGFIDRLLNITESMMLADAYATLSHLEDRPEVDGRKVALMGFSYGGMAAVFAAYEQVAETLAPEGQRFAAHVSFYGPCIARFDRKEATGAPVLMLLGAEDEITDPQRCREIARDLEEGGAPSEVVVYEGAYHQWDGSRPGPRRIGRNLAPCEFRVDEEGNAREGFLGLAMDSPFMRKAILGLCSDSEGYLMGRDDSVRAQSNAEVGQLFRRVFSTHAHSRD
ncbi:MAG: dienelactone hydrolase family protein [Pseudomonadota bacterium]